MTIGNIPKHIRRKPSRQGQILLAYLPTSKLGHITNKASRRHCLSNLFHYCMQSILKPLEKARREGIELVNGDGTVRRCYPILAAYVGDYPEQVLVSIVKSGNCPICPAPRDDIGNWDDILGLAIQIELLPLSILLAKVPPNLQKHVRWRYKTCSVRILEGSTICQYLFLHHARHFASAISRDSQAPYRMDTIGLW